MRQDKVTLGENTKNTASDFVLSKEIEQKKQQNHPDKLLITCAHTDLVCVMAVHMVILYAICHVLTAPHRNIQCLNDIAADGVQ